MTITRLGVVAGMLLAASAATAADISPAVVFDMRAAHASDRESAHVRRSLPPFSSIAAGVQPFASARLRAASEVAPPITDAIHAVSTSQPFALAGADSTLVVHAQEAPSAFSQSSTLTRL